MKIRLSTSIFLFALTTQSFAITPPTFSVSVFGGGGAPDNSHVSQYGTAYFTEASGGPLSVNAFGQLNSPSTSFFGAGLLYQAQDILLNSSSHWTLTPGAELEGYYMSKSTFNGTIHNDTTRLPEHDFAVSYPISRTIFLANAVISFYKTHFRFHPYVGLGFGDAIANVKGANSTQINPAEAGINHYNSNSSDTNSAFAGQIKLGLSYAINKYLSLFIDYRCLYLASTHFVFGSTVYSTHTETSNWQVKLKPETYNLGNVGLRFNL